VEKRRLAFGNSTKFNGGVSQKLLHLPRSANRLLIISTHLVLDARRRIGLTSRNASCVTHRAIPSWRKSPSKSKYFCDIVAKSRVHR